MKRARSVEILHGDRSWGSLVSVCHKGSGLNDCGAKMSRGIETGFRGLWDIERLWAYLDKGPSCLEVVSLWGSVVQEVRLWWWIVGGVDGK